jgi:hypothetical protein
VALARVITFLEEGMLPSPTLTVVRSPFPPSQMLQHPPLLGSLGLALRLDCLLPLDTTPLSMLPTKGDMIPVEDVVFLVTLMGLNV